jgi:hypothetical protein
MEMSFLIPCHHNCILEILEMNERLYMFGDNHQQRADNVEMLVKRGRLVPYIAGVGNYMLYDQTTQKVLVGIFGWPAPPEWVDAADPIDAIANYIRWSTDDNDLEYRADGIKVVCRGHRKAAKALFTKMAQARYGGDAVVGFLQYLGYEHDFDHGITFHYRAMMGAPYGEGGMRGHYDFIHMNLTPPKSSEAKSA